MKVRPWAEFTTDLPDDQIEEGPQIVQFAGKSVAKVVADMLIGCGCEVSAPIHAHEHGWELDIIAGRQRRRLWCQITLIEKYTMVFEQNSWIANVFGQHHPVYLDMLTRLAALLEQDDRFQDVRWYTSDELYARGAGAPLPIEA